MLMTITDSGVFWSAGACSRFDLLGLAPALKAAASRRTPKHSKTLQNTPKHSKTLQNTPESVIVINMELIRFEGIYRLHLRGCRRAFEPRGGTAEILASHSRHSVLDRILMHVVQTRKI